MIFSENVDICPLILPGTFIFTNLFFLPISLQPIWNIFTHPEYFYPSRIFLPIQNIFTHPEYFYPSRIFLPIQVPVLPSKKKQLLLFGRKLQHTGRVNQILEDEETFLDQIKVHSRCFYIFRSSHFTTDPALQGGGQHVV